MENIELEVSKLRNIEESELRKLIGSSIVSAVESSYNTHIEAILAELLVLKFGEFLLDERKVRTSLIDIASESDIRDLAQELGCNKKGYFEIADWIRGYFTTGYNEEKSKLFVDWVGFPKKYYKKIVTDTRREVEKISLDFGETAKLKGYLHPYQKDVKDQILDSLVAPGVRLMVQMPTGSGKTFTALETAVDILRRPFQSNYVVWIVNSNELAEQALQSFKELWKVKGDRPLNTYRLFKDFFPNFKEHAAGGLVFASYALFHSVLSNITDARRESLLHLINNTQYLIVDEAHSAVADTYEECVRAFVNNDSTQIVGLSATPIREDAEEAESLRKLFSSNLISVRDTNQTKVDDPIKYLQSEAYLARVNTETLDSGFVSNENTESSILRSLSEDGERNKLIIDNIENANNSGDKTLVFACTKDHVLALFIMCKSRAIKVDFITGETFQSERPRILEEFNSGDTNVLINLDILSTGVDLPNVNRLIITRPVRSSIQYSQIVGRALRGPKNGGNPQNTIVNVLDNINYFSGISLLYSGFKSAWE